MTKSAFIFLMSYFISSLSLAYTSAQCVGSLNKGESFKLSVFHLGEFDGPYQKFSAVLEIANKRLTYKGLISRFSSHDGYGYDFQSRPEFSTEHSNIYDFAIFEREPVEKPNSWHTEIRYHGKYSGRSECYPPSEMWPGGCLPIFVGKDGSSRMTCTLN